MPDISSSVWSASDAPYGALGVKIDLLHTIMSMIGAVNASDIIDIPSVPKHPRVAVSVEQLHQLTTYMLANEMGERFSVGDYDLLVLRFVVEGRFDFPATLLAVEDYHSPYPALVNGHIIDRASAIRAWLGDGDPGEHPDLYLETGEASGA